MTLKELLDDWTEPDIAQYYVGCCLGLMDYDSSKGFMIVKGFLNYRNNIGTMFYEILEKMVENDILESNELTQYRWNKSFKESWEKELK